MEQNYDILSADILKIIKTFCFVKSPETVTLASASATFFLKRSFYITKITLLFGCFNI